MDRERWQQVDRVFKSALERAPDARAAFLAEACAGDSELRAEVESLIANDRDGSFLERPAVDEAARVAAGGGRGAGSRAGQTVGSYRIIEELGAGGMGEVYRALHQKTGREVALKLLPAEHTADEQRVRRFRQEARAILSLNHPNIVTVYDIEVAGDSQLIATELVEGETLRRRLARAHTAPVAAAEALDIAIQIARALSAAHRAGIVHRDIKPENVMLRADGYVKVLDFGLAKLAETPGADSQLPTVAQVKTEPGMVVGTVRYMSPEQARALPVDERTDIFSLGVLLYEMIAGRPPFEGETAGDLIAAILNREPPPLVRYAPAAPDALEWIVSKSLVKDAEGRYQTARELLADLERLKRRLEYEAEAERATGGVGAGRRETSDAAAPTVSRPATASQGTTAGASAATAPTAVGDPATRTASSAEYIVEGIRRHKLGAAAAVALAAFALAAAGFGLSKLFRPPRPAAAPFETMRIERLTDTGQATDAAVSPDGEFVAYVRREAGRESLWLRQTSAASSSVQISPPADGLRYGAPAFSPDGQYVYYLKAAERSARASLYRVGKLGGDERKLFDEVSLQDSHNNFCLSPDGRRVAFIRLDAVYHRTLVTTNLDGTDERRLASRALPQYLTGAAWSPDGKTVATFTGMFGGRGSGTGQKSVVAVDAAGGNERQLSPRTWAQVSGLAWLGSDGLVISAAEKSGGQQLWHVSASGGATRRITNDLSDYTSVSLTADASAIAAVQNDHQTNVWTAAPGRDSDASAAQLTHGTGRYDGDFGVAWTPEGRIVYYSAAGGNGEIWSMDADGSNQRQLTSGAGLNSFPALSPDGRLVTFNSDRGGVTHAVWLMDADGSNQRQLASEGSMPTFSPDGRWVIFYKTGAGLLMKVPTGGGDPAPIPLPENDNATRPAVSPDGRLIACNYLVGRPGALFLIALVPSEGGAPVRTFAVPGSPIRVLRWTPDGRAVAYVDTRGGVSNVWAQPAEGGEARQLTDFKTGSIASFDFSRDGRRLALSRTHSSSDVVLIRDFK